MDRTLSAFFDNRSDAISAVDDLVAFGISRHHISIISGSEPPEEGAGGGGYGTPEEERGFWATIADLFVPEEDIETYREGVDRGGATVVARVDEDQLGRAVEILEEHDAVDLDKREQQWRSEGWSGPYRPGAAAIGMVPDDAEPHVGKRVVQSGRVRIHTRVVEERHEEPFVSKEPRVTEELHVGNELEERIDHERTAKGQRK